MWALYIYIPDSIWKRTQPSAHMSALPVASSSLSTSCVRDGQALYVRLQAVYMRLRAVHTRLQAVCVRLQALCMRLQAVYLG